MAKTLFSGKIAWWHWFHLPDTIFTDVEKLEIGHLDSMKSLDAFDLCVFNFQLFHILKMDFFHMDFFIWFIINAELAAVLLFHFRAKSL